MDSGYDEVLPPKAVQDRYFGVRYNGPFDTTATFWSPSGYRQKDASIVSDHHRSTPFARRFALVRSNAPAITREDTWDGWWEKHTHLSPDLSAGLPSVYSDSLKSRLDDCETEALVKARMRLRGESFDIGVALAEAISTASLFSYKSSLMALALIRFRHLANSVRVWTAREKLLAAAGAWLEGYYGWGSLARDTYSLASKLNEKLQPPLTVSSSAFIRQSGLSELQLDAVRHQVSSWEVSSKVKYLASVDVPLAREFDSWGLINPLNVGWESVPFSFVIDWFIPVGNVLSSLSATAGLSLVDGAAARTWKGKTHVTYRNENPFSTEQVVSRGGFSVEELNFQRRLLAGFELPSLYGSRNPFATARVVSAVALATQAVLGRTR